MQEVVKYKDCFVCGDQNKSGLQARFFELEDGSVVSEFVAGERFQGYRNILHGGVLAAMLDEVMIKAVLAKGIFAVTAEISMRFRKPVMTGQKVKVEGKITEANRRITRTIGHAFAEDGSELASATATYVEARGDLETLLKDSVE